MSKYSCLLKIYGIKIIHQYSGPEVQHRILMKHQIQIANIKFKLQTSNSNYKHQIQIRHIKFKFITSNSNSSHQIQIHHIKFKFITSNLLKFITSKSNSSHQIQIHHIKFKFITSNAWSAVFHRTTLLLHIIKNLR